LGWKRPAGMPWLMRKQVKKNVKVKILKGKRDTRRRIFEGFVPVVLDKEALLKEKWMNRQHKRNGVKLDDRARKRVLERVDWRKEGWFEQPRARPPKPTKGRRKGKGTGCLVDGKKEPPKKYVSISTAKYDHY